MGLTINQYIQQKLQERTAHDNYRLLKPALPGADFTSNDYLGLANDAALKEAVLAEYQSEALGLGSTGSRLLSGNSAYAEELETKLAQFHDSEAALLFNSGFDANYGLLSSLPYRGDTVIYDELVHASIHDGVRHSKATTVAFKHNNTAHLEELLKQATGLKYVVVESVYSMDGDEAPLIKIAELCTTYGAGLIIDEAHATGIMGPNGQGLAYALNIHHACLARLCTFGKAIGAHGAVVLGSHALKAFLLNFCRPLIYSTALPYHSLANIKVAYRWLAIPEAQQRRQRLFQLIELFRQQVQSQPGKQLLSSNTPVQSVVVPGNSRVKQFAQHLQQSGFNVRPILYPTVPQGSERVRICLHSFNTEQEVIKLATTINAF